MYAIKTLREFMFNIILLNLCQSNRIAPTSNIHFCKGMLCTVFHFRAFIQMWTEIVKVEYRK